MGVEILTAVEVNCKPIGQVFEFTDVLQYWISGFNQERWVQCDANLKKFEKVKSKKKQKSLQRVKVKMLRGK